MGIVLGLLTALAWGSADLCARFSARKIGTFRTMLYMQLTGFLLLTAALPWLGGWGHLADGTGLRPWAWGLLAGVLNTAGTLALYRSFEIGKMSIVAPISASYPALTMLLASTTGEHLTPVRMVGFFLILVGVVVVAQGESPSAETGETEKKHAGVGWALLAALGFGVMFWLLGVRVIPMAGSAQSVWLVRLTCVVLTVPIMLLARQPIKLPSNGGGVPWILGVGVLDTAAYVLNNYGMKLEQVSVISVLASLYGAVTVGLAATILGEKISRTQWLGIAAIFAGIILISR
jgi:drug/metabolite transporter (DMT)-like permease